MSARVRISIGDREFVAVVAGARVTIEGHGEFVVTPSADGVRVEGAEVITARSGDHVWTGVGGHVLDAIVSTGPRRSRSSAADHDALVAPMAATVVRIAVTPGGRVRSGDLLIALEAMKMELPIRAPRDGVVHALHCREGELVQAGASLVELEPETAS
jgi:biotin carboxyl carrier protein